MLTQHIRAGNIRRVARGVFASVPKHADARSWPIDRFLAASCLRVGGVIAYHSALELHGCAYTEGHDVQVIAPGAPCLYKADGFACRFVKPHRAFINREGSLLSEGVTFVDRLGLAVEVTTIERTVADLFDRHDLAGGAEELFDSLDLVARIDAGKLAQFVKVRGNAAAAGALGFWLECEQKRLGASDGELEYLRTLAPRRARYALGSRPGTGRMARGWNVILPVDVIERRFEGL